MYLQCQYQPCSCKEHTRTVILCHYHDMIFHVLISTSALGKILVHAKDPRILGSQDYQILGLLDPRIVGSQDCRILGLLDPRIVGSQDCRILGLLDPRIVGSQDCWILGLTDPRIVSSQYCTILRFLILGFLNRYVIEYQ